MSRARIWVKVKLDNTGRSIRLPVILLLSEGRLTVLKPLVAYLITHHHRRSHSWMTKLCEIVGKLLDYIDAHHRQDVKPVHLFDGFVNAIYNGTFDENNVDKSELCWFPSNTKTVNPKLRMLENFSDWMVREGYVSESLNQWAEAVRTEERLNWITWYRRNKYSFLGHLGPSANDSAELAQARMVKLRRQPMRKSSEPKAFPEDFEVALLRDGFVRPGKENEVDIIEKYDWRGICIAILLLFGAKRMSEPFHLWVGDVMENPVRPGEAIVRIYHPVEGQAPETPKINGRRAPNRQAYLQAFHPNYGPRNLARGNYHAGFKGVAFTNDKAQFLQVFWLPSHMGKAFLLAYHNYMLLRARRGIDGLRHPFAFVSHQGEHKGEPYPLAHLKLRGSEPLNESVYRTERFMARLHTGGDMLVDFARTRGASVNMKHRRCSRTVPQSRSAHTGHQDQAKSPMQWRLQPRESC